MRSHVIKRSSGDSTVYFTAIAHHRNGIGGEPFHVIRFKDYERGREPLDFVAIVYAANGHIAVLDEHKIGEGVIAFGENSWRGDQYETALRAWIKEHEYRGETAA